MKKMHFSDGTVAWVSPTGKGPILAGMKKLGVEPVGSEGETWAVMMGRTMLALAESKLDADRVNAALRAANLQGHTRVEQVD